jgi:hypothetical protein
MMGIDPRSVELVQSDLPVLTDMVLVDCPDPDTTEQPDGRGNNLARLRQILPHCDVLLVATTQQKYRSARVADELAAAASGARLVFVQTHADVDQDIREDWRELLDPDYRTGHIFLVDSSTALLEAQQGLQPRGELAGLLDLLTRQLAGTAATRIRRANFLDLVSETLEACSKRMDGAMPPIEQLGEAIQAQRARLAGVLADRMRCELMASRRQWESRLVGKAASRWGFSPFALLLRIYQGLGGLFSSALLVRARTPAQLALWGAMEAGRSLRRQRSRRRADTSADRAMADCWSQGELREATIILDGYASEAGLQRDLIDLKAVTGEAASAGRDFVAGVSTEVDVLLDRVAAKHTRWFTRWGYELLLIAMLGFLLFRPAKNFFYDSWFATSSTKLYGLEFYLLSAFWLLLWCCLLLWGFTGRLRRGLRKQIRVLSEGWGNPRAAEGIFVGLERACSQVKRFRQELEGLRQHVVSLRRRLALPDEQLGRRR